MEDYLIFILVAGGLALVVGIACLLSRRSFCTESGEIRVYEYVYGSHL